MDFRNIHKLFIVHIHVRFVINIQHFGYHIPFVVVVYVLESGSHCIALTGLILAMETRLASCGIKCVPPHLAFFLHKSLHRFLGSLIYP